MAELYKASGSQIVETLLEFTLFMDGSVAKRLISPLKSNLSIADKTYDKKSLELLQKLSVKQVDPAALSGPLSETTERAIQNALQFTQSNDLQSVSQAGSTAQAYDAELDAALQSLANGQSQDILSVLDKDMIFKRYCKDDQIKQMIFMASAV